MLLLSESVFFPFSLQEMAIGRTTIGWNFMEPHFLLSFFFHRKWAIKEVGLSVCNFGNGTKTFYEISGNVSALQGGNICHLFHKIICKFVNHIYFNNK